MQVPKPVYVEGIQQVSRVVTKVLCGPEIAWEHLPLSHLDGPMFRLRFSGFSSMCGQFLQK